MARIIFEFGCNHNGELDIAKKMIDRAAELGAWGIKLQKRDIESIPEEVGSQKRDKATSFGETYLEHRKALEFSTREMKEIKECAEIAGLRFVCSAFDVKSVDDLLSIGCQDIKLPSQLYLDMDMYNRLMEAEESLNIHVSTGMHDFREIENGAWIKDADVVYHCTSIYPARVEEANLETIRALREICNGQVGYSSHEVNGIAIPYAVAAGATYIERHFTLDKTMKGSDHGTVSSDQTEMRLIVAQVRAVEAMLGVKRVVNDREAKTRKVYRGI